MVKEKEGENLQEIMDTYIEKHKIEDDSIVARPKDINKEMLKKLKKSHIKTIELIAYSSNNYILKRCQASHTFEQIKKASKLIKWHGFKLGIQMMVGMPDSTKLDDFNTAKDFAKLKPKIVRIYPYLVMKNTLFAKEYAKGEYEPITVGQAVERCKESVYLFHQKKIETIHIGLQNTEGMPGSKKEKSNVIAGPYHPDFAGLVEDSIWYDSIVEKIKKVNAKVKEVKVTVNPKNVDNVIGHQKANLQKLKETYDVDVLVQKDDTIKEGKSQIEVLSIYED